ncbi:MAG: DUF2809 domain-containing protein [Chitinivibrionales bacterium]|nr:DUF2809 domain-containing protein [Chitinivibrionales bacterium]MBD3395186.1 DUF2809 domain-containing protein [Chitinivibrionales bacterium]
MHGRARAVLFLAVLVPVGFASKFYTGWGAPWVNNSLGGVLYVIFWCLAIFVLFPQERPSAIAAAVFTATSLLEILQLWHPSFLESIRSTFVGATLIGTTFVWSDFFYYAIGCIAGWIWVDRLKLIH